MSLQLVAFDDQPGRLAATKSGSTVPDGRFFLDFTRPLQVIRWFGVRNRFFGATVGLGVPVVHEAESAGGYVVSVIASDAHFCDIRNCGSHISLQSPGSLSSKRMASRSSLILRSSFHKMFRKSDYSLRGIEGLFLHELEPNPTLNRTCNSVLRPGLISLWPGRRPLPHAG